MNNYPTLGNVFRASEKWRTLYECMLGVLTHISDRPRKAPSDISLVK